MATVIDVFIKAQALSFEERKELLKLLIDTFDTNEPVTQPKTGAEIVAMLEAIDPIEFVDPHIENSTE